MKFTYIVLVLLALCTGHASRSLVERIEVDYTHNGSTS